jgi:phosphopantetheinyl transferase
MLSREIWVRYQSFETLEDAEESDAWLSEAERRECERYRDEGRLRQVRAGRYLAKKLLREQLVPWSIDSAEIEILSRDNQNRAVRPEVRVQGTPEPWCVSISHSGRGVLVGISLNPQIQVGVDLAEKEELNPSSLVFWFSHRERDRLRGAGARPATVCWTHRIHRQRIGGTAA